jgi:hypothetical protein
MIGLLPFMAPIYAVLIVSVMYFGIKIYVGRKKKAIALDVGEGLCMECGSNIINKKCPNCDSGE